MRPENFCRSLHVFCFLLVLLAHLEVLPLAWVDVPDSNPSCSEIVVINLALGSILYCLLFVSQQICYFNVKKTRAPEPAQWTQVFSNFIRTLLSITGIWGIIFDIFVSDSCKSWGTSTIPLLWYWWLAHSYLSLVVVFTDMWIWTKYDPLRSFPSEDGMQQQPRRFPLFLPSPITPISPLSSLSEGRVISPSHRLLPSPPESPVYTSQTFP